MARARIASAIQSKVGALIYGEQFTGKSTLASEFTYYKRPDGKPFRVLFLDAENGSIDDYIPNLEENGVDVRNLYIVYTQSLGEVREYISKVKNNEDLYMLDEDGNETDEVVLDADGQPFRADAIVVDGTTILNLSVKQGLTEFSKKRNTVKAKAAGLVGDERLVKIEGSGLELKDYNTINFRGQNLILDLMGCGVHYVITARETDEKVSVKDSDGKITSVATGRKIPDSFKGIAYNVKTVIRTFLDDDGVVCAEIEKDRTGVHTANEVIENPSFLDWQSVIDKTAGNKAYVIKNDLVKAVEIENNIYEREILGAAGDITDSKSTASAETSDNKISDLKAEISAIQKAMNPVQKSNAKKALTEAGLPTAIKSVTDMGILNKCLEVLSNIK